MTFRLCMAVLMASAVVAQAEPTPGSLFLATNSTDNASISGLFVGRERGLFADRPAVTPIFSNEPILGLHGRDVEMIRDLIQEAESRADGYDAIQNGALIRPKNKPSHMTLEEIFAWIDRTPGQPHAIGRYQFIPDTLRRLVIKAGLKPSQRFSPSVQDRLANILLAEAGLHHFRAGTLDRQSFMNNLAKIWAGLPNSSGKSHYHDYAGNRASISWARFDSVMERISPDHG